MPMLRIDQAALGSPPSADRFWDALLASVGSRLVSFVGTIGVFDSLVCRPMLCWVWLRDLLLFDGGIVL